MLPALLVVLFAGSTAYAHTFARDGSIGAVLHTDPNDDPSAGSPATLYLDIQDTAHNFSSGQCDCQLAVTLGSRQLASLPVTSYGTSYTFPGQGVYVLTLSGSPLGGGTFQPFLLHFNLRVEPARAAAASGLPPFAKAVILATLGIGLMAILIVGVVYRPVTNVTGGKR
jgi:hypothetical protein